MKKRRFHPLLCLLLAVVLAGCGGAAPAGSGNSTDSISASSGEAMVENDISATLSFGSWRASDVQIYNELGLEERFRELYPNVKLEIEETKDDTEYFNALLIRASANQMPDLMFNQSRTFANFKDHLVDLGDLQAAKDNLLADGYAINGKILGIPEKRQEEYVLFWRDMFDEAGVDVPQTWEEFYQTAETLQAHFGTENPDFMAIALGAKDEWPIYPLMENMPAALSGNGQYWNDMTTQDAPFAEGTAIHTAYDRIQDLFRTGVFGKDPLGMGYDQAFTLFSERGAAMALDSPIGVTILRESGSDPENLESFYLPFREDKNDPYYLPVRGDFFLSVTTSAKHPELAKAFVEFYFSSAWYPDYIDRISSASTMESFPKELDPVLLYADKYAPNAEMIMYDGGNDDFHDLCAETRFDCKRLGAEMFTEGFDLEAKLAQLDTDWTAGRQKLGL